MFYVASMLIGGVSGLLPLLPAMALFQFIMRRKNRERNWKTAMPHILAVYVFCLVLLTVLSVTSIPDLFHLTVDVTINLIPFANIRTSFHQYALNILLFVPVGLLLPMLWNQFAKKRATFLCGFLFSLSIELIQMLNHRITDIDDLLMNTLGTIVGYFLFMWVKRMFPKVSIFAIGDTNHWKWEFYACFCLAWLSMLLFQRFNARLLLGPPRIIW